MRTAKPWIGILLLALCASPLGAATDAAKAAYEKHCLKCHGVNGDGKGKAGAKLKPLPTDFTSEKFQKRTDEQIFDATKNGSKAVSVEVSKKMPGYSKKLDDAQIKEQVQLMREFAPKK